MLLKKKGLELGFHFFVSRVYFSMNTENPGQKWKIKKNKSYQMFNYSDFKLLFISNVDLMYYLQNCATLSFLQFNKSYNFFESFLLLL